MQGMSNIQYILFTYTNSINQLVFVTVPVCLIPEVGADILCNLLRIWNTEFAVHRQKVWNLPFQDLLLLGISFALRANLKARLCRLLIVYIFMISAKFVPNESDTLSLVCLLRVNASTCFGLYTLVFRRQCKNAIWCNYVRRMCVDCVQVAVPARSQHTTYARNYTKQQLCRTSWRWTSNARNM
jgi:hypothetical protein